MDHKNLYILIVVLLACSSQVKASGFDTNNKYQTKLTFSKGKTYNAPSYKERDWQDISIKLNFEGIDKSDTMPWLLGGFLSRVGHVSFNREELEISFESREWQRDTLGLLFVGKKHPWLLGADIVQVDYKQNMTFNGLAAADTTSDSIRVKVGYYVGKAAALAIGFSKIRDDPGFFGDTQDEFKETFLDFKSYTQFDPHGVVFSLLLLHGDGGKFGTYDREKIGVDFFFSKKTNLALSYQNDSGFSVSEVGDLLEMNFNSFVHDKFSLGLMFRRNPRTAGPNQYGFVTNLLF